MKPMESPVPAVMPVDREKWAKGINLSNFVNSAYQHRDLRSCGEVRTSLMVPDRAWTSTF